MKHVLLAMCLLVLGCSSSPEFTEATPDAGPVEGDLHAPCAKQSSNPADCDTLRENMYAALVDPVEALRCMPRNALQPQPICRIYCGSDFTKPSFDRAEALCAAYGGACRQRAPGSGAWYCEVP